MKKDNLINIFKKSFSDFGKNLIITFPTILLFIFLILFSNISVEINNLLNTNILLTIWLVIFSLISLAVIAFFFSGLIGMAYESVRKETKIGDMWSYSRRLWFKNFLIIFAVLIVYNVLRYLAHKIALLVGYSLNLEANAATGVFFVLYVAGLMGVIIFLTFSSFYLVIKNKGVWVSIKESARLVKGEYLGTLSIILVFFVVNGALSLWDQDAIVEVINTLFIIPYMALVLTRFVLNYDKVK